MAKMIEAFPAWAEGGGIFSSIVNPVWGTDRWSAADLDLMYYTEHGEKTASALVDKLSTDGIVSDQNLKTLARIVQSRFGEQWKRRFAVLSVEYNPANNYDMVEEEGTTRTGSHAETYEINRTHQDTDTTTLDLTETRNNTKTLDITDADTGTTQTTKNTSETSENQNGVFGFNSSTAVPSENGNASKTSEENSTNTQNLQHTQTGTDTDSGTVKNSGTDTINRNGTSKDTESKENTDTDNVNRKLTRSGNIGVTTTQQMLDSEIKLWAWDFLEGVFEDVNKLLTLPIYE